jgi:hypothetical protein
MQALTNLVGLAALVMVGAITAWYAGEGRKQRPPPAPPALPAFPGDATP